MDFISKGEELNKEQGHLRVFALGGGREMVSGARAKELLLHAIPNPQSVRLSNKSLTLEVFTY